MNEYVGAHQILEDNTKFWKCVGIVEDIFEESLYLTNLNGKKYIFRGLRVSKIHAGMQKSRVSIEQCETGKVRSMSVFSNSLSKVAMNASKQMSFVKQGKNLNALESSI